MARERARRGALAHNAPDAYIRALAATDLTTERKSRLGGASAGGEQVRAGWPLDGAGKWQVISKAIESWAATFRLAFILVVLGVLGWGGWLLIAILLGR